MAAEAGLPVDLHTDETLDARMLHLPDLADRVVDDRLPARGHRQSLREPRRCSRRGPGRGGEEVAAAGIAVVTLPQTNLYLQGRECPTATPRGPHRPAGLCSTPASTLAAGADNLQDPFNLVGRADPFETAALMVMAGHLSPGEAFHAVAAGSARRHRPASRSRWSPGAPAELVAMPADGVREAIATAPSGRIVIHRGQVVTP